MSNKLPSYLYGTYRQSKDNTQYCTEWLVHTAKQVGHDISRYIWQTEGTTEWQTKTKANERQPKTPSIHVKVNDLLLLANTIAVRWPDVKIDDNFMRKLRQTLQARKVCAAWFAGCEGPDAEESNQRHVFFIRVLDAVLELFVPLYSQQRTEQSANYIPFQKVHRQTPWLESVIQSRPLEEATEEFQDLNLNDSHSSPKSDNQNDLPVEGGPTAACGTVDDDKVVLEESDVSEGDWNRFFMLHSLFLDLHRIRSFVRQAWIRYRAGQSDLVTASALTNTAIDIAINLEVEAGLIMPADKCLTACPYNAVIIQFFLRKMRAHSEETLNKSMKNSEDANLLPTDSRDFIFLREWAAAADFMKGFLANMSETTTTAVQKRKAKRAKQKGRSKEDEAIGLPAVSGEVPKLNAASSMDYMSYMTTVGLSAWQKYLAGDVSGDSGSDIVVDPQLFCFPESHSKLLQAAFSDSMDWKPTRTKVATHNTVVDLVLERIRDMCMGFHPSLSTAFAVRLFLDTHEILGEEHIARPLAELDATAVSCRMKARLQVLGLKKVGIDDDHHFKHGLPDGFLTTQARLVDRISTLLLEDICEQDENMWFCTQKNIRGRLRQNPIACGLHQFYLEELQSICALSLADARCILMGFAHFYNTVNVTGELSLPWPDLEFLIHIHSPEKLFLGGRPENLLDCLNRYGVLIYGTGTFSSTASVRPSTSLPKPKLDYRRQLLTGFSPLAKYLFARFQCMGRIKDTKVGLNSGMNGQIVDLEDLQLVVVELNRNKARHSIQLKNGTVTNKKQLRKRTGRSYLSPIDLLSSIERLLPEEMKALRFDHGALERRCMQAMDRMRDAMLKAGLEAKTDQHASKLESSVIMDPMLSYWHIKNMEPLMKYRGSSKEWDKGWFADTMTKWNAVVEGLDGWLKEMKKKGVKDLKDEVEGK